MKKELWDRVKLVNEGKVEVSKEETLEIVREGYAMLLEDSITIGKLEGQADVFIAGGKGLVAAGTLWLLFGNLAKYSARKMAEKYKMD